MHLQVHSLSVDGVFRSSMEMELNTCEKLVCSEDIAGNIGREGLSVLICLVDGDLGGLTPLPHDLDVLNLIGIELVEVVGSSFVIGVALNAL